MTREAPYPGAWENECCPSVHYVPGDPWEWYCTLEKGHECDHEAHGGSEAVFVSWPYEPSEVAR